MHLPCAPQGQRSFPRARSAHEPGRFFPHHPPKKTLKPSLPPDHPDHPDHPARAARSRRSRAALPRAAPRAPRAPGAGRGGTWLVGMLGNVGDEVRAGALCACAAAGRSASHHGAPVTCRVSSLGGGGAMRWRALALIRWRAEIGDVGARRARWPAPRQRRIGRFCTEVFQASS